MPYRAAGRSTWYPQCVCPARPNAEQLTLSFPGCDLSLAGIQHGSAASHCRFPTYTPFTLSSLPRRQMEEVLNLNEDYIFLRKVQKCQTAEGQKSTLLDCEKILKAFQDLQCKVCCC